MKVNVWSTQKAPNVSVEEKMCEKNSRRNAKADCNRELVVLVKKGEIRERKIFLSLNILLKHVLPKFGDFSFLFSQQQ